jgi:hypothetical protein
VVEFLLYLFEFSLLADSILAAKAKMGPKKAQKPTLTARQVTKLLEAGLDPFAADDQESHDAPAKKPAATKKELVVKKGRASKSATVTKKTLAKKSVVGKGTTDDTDDDQESMAVEDEDSDLQSVESLELKRSPTKRSHNQISVLETHSKPSPPKGKAAKISKASAGKSVTKDKKEETKKNNAPIKKRVAEEPSANVSQVDAPYVNPNAMWAAPSITNTSSIPRVPSGVSVQSSLGSASSSNNISSMDSSIKKKERDRDTRDPTKPYIPLFHEDLSGYMYRVGNNALSISAEDLAIVHESLGEDMDPNAYVRWTSFQPARVMHPLFQDSISAHTSNEEKSFTDHYGVRGTGAMEEHLGGKNLLEINDNYDVDWQEMYKATKMDMYRNASEDFLSTITIPAGHSKSDCGVMEGIDYSAPARQLQHLLNSRSMIQADNVQNEKSYGPTSTTWWGIRSDPSLSKVLKGRIANLRQDVTHATREQQKKLADKRRVQEVADLQRKQQALAAEMLTANTAVDREKQRKKADALKSRGQASGLVTTLTTSGSSSAGYNNAARAEGDAYHSNRDNYSHRNDSAGYNNSNDHRGNNSQDCNNSDRSHHHRNHHNNNTTTTNQGNNSSDKKKKHNKKKHKNNDRGYDNNNSGSNRGNYGGDRSKERSNHSHNNRNDHRHSSNSNHGNKYGSY